MCALDLGRSQSTAFLIPVSGSWEYEGESWRLDSVGADGLLTLPVAMVAISEIGQQDCLEQHNSPE